MATGEVELTGATIDTNQASVDAGAACVVTRYQFQPKLGIVGTQYETRIVGGKLQGDTTNLFLTAVDYDTIPSAPFYRPRVWNWRSTTSPASKRYWRLLGASAGNFKIEDIRFIATAGPADASAKPCRPTASPWGGRFPTGSTTVTLASPTTSASLYYTTDGSTPDNTDTLYTGPFSLPIGSDTVTLKVIAHDASLGTTYSDVISAEFHQRGYKNNNTTADGSGFIYDDKGDRVEAHSGCWWESSTYVYWVGVSANGPSTNATQDAIGYTGIWLYRSAKNGNENDYLNWECLGQILQNPGSWPYVIRVTVLHNEANDELVLWARAYNPATPEDGTAVIATCPSSDANPGGSWTWDDVVGIEPDGHNTYDFSLFKDEDGTGYLNLDHPGGSHIYELASDYMDVTGSGVSIGGHDQPTMLRFGEMIYRPGCAIGNYYDSTSTFGPEFRRAKDPLGPWSGPIEELFASDPVGSNLNGQNGAAITLADTSLLRPYIWFGDWWVQSDHYESSYVFLPFIIDYKNNKVQVDVSADPFNPTEYFTPPATKTADDFGYYKTITVSNTHVTADLTNFDLLVDLTADTDIAAHCDSDFINLRFTDSTGTTLLPYERINNSKQFIVKCTPTTAASLVIRVYYDTANIVDGESPHSAYNSDYAAVYHLEEDPGTGDPGSYLAAVDSTEKENHAYPNGGMVTANLVSASVEKGYSFNGSSNVVDVEFIPELHGATTATIQAIVNRTGSGNSVAIGFFHGATPNTRFGFNAYTDGNVYFFVENGSASFPFVAMSGTAVHTIQMAWDGSQSSLARLKVYIDGALQSLTGGGADPAASLSTYVAFSFTIGKDASNAPSFTTGKIDEVQVSSTNRSAAWMTFWHYNRMSGDNELTIGLEQTNTTPLTPDIATIPANHAGTIEIILTNASGVMDGTTVISFAGPSGSAMASYTVLTATTVRVRVTTGAGTGTLTFTESVTGSAIGTVTVATATISVTPTSALLNSEPLTLTFATTNIDLTQENAVGLVSVSGGAGAALGPITIDNANQSHADLISGAGTGTLTITLNPVSGGVSDTIGVAAATAYYAIGSNHTGVNVPKTYAIFANGTSTVTVTGHTTGTGSFGGTVTLSGITPQLMTYTPTAFNDSPHTLSWTDSGSLTDPSNIILVVREHDGLGISALYGNLFAPLDVDYVIANGRKG